MRTSFDIPDELFKKVKVTMAKQGISMKELMIRSIQKTRNRISSQKKVEETESYFQRVLCYLYVLRGILEETNVL